MTKQEILDNPAALPAEQLAEAVRSGTVTVFELVRTGKLDTAHRLELKEALDRPVQAEEQKPDSSGTPQHVILKKTSPASVAGTDRYEAPVSDRKVSWKAETTSDTELKPRMPHKSGKYIETEQAPVAGADGVYRSEEPIDQIKNRPMFRHFFTPRGRITRTEYLLSYILVVPYYMLMYMWSLTIPGYEAIPVLCLWLYIYIIAVAGIKRCHDLGHKGWWQLIPLYFLWMFFKCGNKEPNQYGISPYKSLP